MQRRLVLAMVGLALTTVVLVGAGVLALAQFGARQSARDDVAGQLEALAEVFESSAAPERLDDQLRRLASGFNISRLEVVAIGENGQARRLERRTGPVELSTRITQEDRAVLESGENLLLDSGRSVIGLRSIDFEARGGSRPEGLIFAVLIQQDVAKVGQQPVVWFLLSAGAVLLGSLVLATWLADRFIRPIRSIEAATTSIARGELSTRVDIAGDDELAELGQSVNRMAADLERSRAAEHEFLLSVSHDLRTPLTSISGYAEALIDEAIDDPKKAGTVIATNAGRLNRLVDDLLDLARLNSKQFALELRTVDVAQLVVDAVASHEPAASEYEIGLSAQIQASDALALADADRLAQAIGNVIDNALKYAANRVTATVTASTESITITVSDDGPGIPLDDLPFVFERLYVTKLQPRRAENASGLGLAIVKELIEAMGGTVGAARGVAAGENQGTTITVNVPRAV